MSPRGSKCLLIYGSQTGQSQAIAEQIAFTSLSWGLDVELLCGEELVEHMERLDNQVVMFVVSSTGEGDPPENFEEFWAALNDRPPRTLTYTLLGLGDSNYTEFGGFPNTFNHFLEESGAKSFYEFQLADDQVGLELVVEPWIEGLWEPLTQALTNHHNLYKQDSLKLDPTFIEKLATLQINRDRPKTKQMFDSVFSLDEFNPTFPFGIEGLILPFAAGSLEKSTVLSKTCLTEKSEKTKETFEIELSTTDTYGPGDSFGILCQNSEEEVMELLDTLEITHIAHRRYTLNPDPGVKPRLLPKHVLLECTPYYTLKYAVDVHSLPKKALLFYLSECCSVEQEGDSLYFLASKEGSSDLNDVIYSRALTLLEILQLFPSCRPTFVGLLQYLPRLTPRYYSVSRTSEQGLKFVFNHVTNVRVVEEELPAVPGVCSTWLKGLRVGGSVWVYRRRNERFTPREEDRALIMLGAGTGVAPFLGFLDHLAAQPVERQTVLITGNRYKQLDSIYGKEFSEHQTTGTLKSYRSAYSRDATSTCKYVQDVLERDAKEIVGYLDEGAVVYVCGDAKGLSVGVHDKFKSMLCEVKGISEAEAREVLTGMRRDGRYCEDIWS